MAKTTRQLPSDFLDVAEVFEKRWVIQILQVLVLQGEVYFSDFTRSVPQLSDRLLSLRLRELDELQLVERVEHEGHRATYRFAQSTHAKQFQKVLAEMAKISFSAVKTG
jgi:DNA-binding HxlR family transcriptional regulator